jgi:hypothetical protein
MNDDFDARSVRRVLENRVNLPPVSLQAKFTTYESTIGKKVFKPLVNKSSKKSWYCYLFLVWVNGQWLAKIGHSPDPTARCLRLMYDLNRAALHGKAYSSRKRNFKLPGIAPTVVTSGVLLAIFRGGRFSESALHHAFTNHRVQIDSSYRFMGCCEFFEAFPVIHGLKLIKEATSCDIHFAPKAASYREWQNVFRGCTTISSPLWGRLGARGIDICTRWRRFENFYRDMGERPKGCTLGRIDQDRDFELTNCVWQTPKARRSTAIPLIKLNVPSRCKYAHNGAYTFSLPQWSRLLAIPLDTLYDVRTQFPKKPGPEVLVVAYGAERLLAWVEKNHAEAGLAIRFLRGSLRRTMIALIAEERLSMTSVNPYRPTIPPPRLND